MLPSSRKAFTLIELLIVIAIIAILAVVVIFALNPAELLRQSRDSNRLSDLSTMTDAINIYSTDQGAAVGYSLGATSTSYLSVSDPSATSTAGDQCQGLGMPSSSYGYACAASSSFHNVNSQGWIPVNFLNISSGAPLGSLPVDPTDNTSSDLYYTYETNGTTYELSTFLESVKYAKTGVNDGSSDPTLAESGSGVSTLPDTGRGLVGYWPLNEGVNSTALDWSGGGNNGAWYGTASGTSGYYTSPGKDFSYAGTFNGVNNGIGITVPTSSLKTNFTWSVWVNFITLAANNVVLDFQRPFMTVVSQKLDQDVNVSGTDYAVTGGPIIATGTWYMFTGTYNGANESIYVNGSLAASAGVSGAQSFNATFCIGAHGGCSSLYSNAYIQDVRIYDRVLSASEIQEMYNAEK
jgi:prepilin-type N-terminal cleavage/methylation domain-containing protein